MQSVDVLSLDYKQKKRERTEKTFFLSFFAFTLLIYHNHLVSGRRRYEAHCVIDHFCFVYVSQKFAFSKHFCLAKLIDSFRIAVEAQFKNTENSFQIDSTRIVAFLYRF